MSPSRASLVRGLVIVAGFGVAVASLLSMRWADWPIYVTYVLLSVVLYRPTVEVLPGMLLPMPGLALSIGFLYVGGLPIVGLNNVGSTLVLLVRAILPERWRVHLPELRGGGTEFVARLRLHDAGAWADWAGAYLGLGARWAIVSALVPGAPPATEPMAMIVAEVGGYLVWTALTLLPVFSFRPVLRSSVWESPTREIRMDLGLIMVLALTPFVFLIAYGYERHGLPGAVAWSLSALGLHFTLKRLNERRLRLETLDRELEHRERLSAIGKMSSVVSHQMLQQLGVIGIHADLIRNGGAGADQTAAVAQAKLNAVAIEEALGAVNRVLTDLLVFSRDLRLNLYRHELEPLVRECLEDCRPAAAARGVDLRLTCAPGIRATFDKLKIRQAIVNLLRNAIEASPAGGAVLVDVAARDGAAEIAVSDAGPGIPERDRESIFTPFFTTKEDGTGLGLAIAREFTEAHRGRIAVESRDGRGATFVLQLPLGGP